MSRSIFSFPADNSVFYSRLLLFHINYMYMPPLNRDGIHTSIIGIVS